MTPPPTSASNSFSCPRLNNFTDPSNPSSFQKFTDAAAPALNVFRSCASRTRSTKEGSQSGAVARATRQILARRSATEHPSHDPQPLYWLSTNNFPQSSHPPMLFNTSANPSDNAPSTSSAGFDIVSPAPRKVTTASCFRAESSLASFF